MDQGFQPRVLSVDDLKALAGLIDAANPYVAVEPKKELQSDSPVFIEFELKHGVYVEKGHTPGKNPTYKLRLDKGVEIQETPTEWKFKGTSHYVKRVIRIPYMFYQVTNKQPGNVGTAVLVHDYWLVAFEGSGGY